MSTDAKAVLKVEGEQSFAAAFKNATSSVKALDSAVKLNNAAFENSENKMESMQQKSALLRKEIEAQKEVIKLNDEELKRLTAEYGEGSTEVNNYQTKVNQANTKLEVLEKTLRENEQAMDDFGKSSVSVGDTLTKLGSKVESLGNKIKWLSAGAVAGLTAMFNSASELNENLNKTEVIFDELSEGIEAWSKTTLDAYGISQSSALEMISLFGDMATSMGLTNEQAAEMGKELVGRAGDMASFKNVSLEVAQSGLSAIFTGQAQNLKKFGIVMTEANLEAYALAEGFTKTYKEMDQAEQVMLRYQYVMDMTKNSAGDFANTSDGAANSVRVAQESLKEAAATLGQEVIPLVLPLIQDVTELIKGVNALDDGTKQLIVRGLAITAVASPILTIGGKMITGIGWMAKTGLPALTTAFGTAQTAGVTSATTVGTAISGMLGPISLAITAGLALAAVMAKVADSYENARNAQANYERFSSATAGKVKIDDSMSQYYRPEDLVSFWNGSGWDTYVTKGAQMTKTGQRDYNDYLSDYYSSGSGTVNNYNMDINVSSIDDLQDLINIADQAQLVERMG